MSVLSEEERAVEQVPACDICGARPESIVDAPTRLAAWACMCENCWGKFGRYPGKLGTGLGQRWVKRRT